SPLVEAVACEVLGEQGVGRTETVIGLIDRFVVDGFVALGAHELTGQNLGVLVIVDETLEPGGRRGTDRRTRRLRGFILAEVGGRGVAQARSEERRVGTGC